MGGEAVEIQVPLVMTEGERTVSLNSNAACSAAAAVGLHVAPSRGGQTSPAQQQAGRMGEALVHLLLKEQQQELLQELQEKGAADFPGVHGVLWVNEAEESGLPYDLQMREPDGRGGARTVYVEVKATRSADKDVFEMSLKELMFSVQHGDAYRLFRVFGVGTDSVRVLKISNPAQYYGRHLKLLLTA